MKLTICEILYKIRDVVEAGDYKAAVELSEVLNSMVIVQNYQIKNKDDAQYRDYLCGMESIHED